MSDSINLDNNSTITLGDTNASHELTAIMNLSCPFCHKWWSNNKDDLLDAINNKQILFHMKFLTKDHLPLLIGNIANRYVDFNDSKASFKFVSNLEDNFDEFKAHSPKDVIDYLTKQYNVEQHNSSEEIENVSNDLKEAGVKTIPTLILDGEWHADSSWNLPKLD